MADSNPIDLGPQTVRDSFGATWAVDAGDAPNHRVVCGWGEGLPIAGSER